MPERADDPSKDLMPLVHRMVAAALKDGEPDLIGKPQDVAVVLGRIASKIIAMQYTVCVTYDLAYPMPAVLSGIINHAIELMKERTELFNRVRAILAPGTMVNLN